MNRRKTMPVILSVLIFVLLCVAGPMLSDKAFQEIGEETVSLKPGIYELKIEYQLDTNLQGTVEVCSASGDSALKSNVTSLYAGLQEMTYDFYVLGRVDDVYVQKTAGEGVSLMVSSISVRNTGKLLSVCVASFGILIGLFLGISFLCRRDKRYILIILGVVLVSLPLGIDYLPSGADMTFHLLRIGGIKDGLLSGQFPVRIQPNWLEGHGYAVSVFYCDLFLYFSAILRMIGFSVQFSYQMYKLFVNTMTFFLAFYSFKRMTGSFERGLFGSYLYAFGTVRLVYIYGVDGVGQFTAMAFLPLILYGFWEILTSKKEEKPKTLPLVLGLTGMVCSHVLTCEIVAFFVLLMCIACWNQVFTKNHFFALCKVLISTILLNLWYLIPFLDYSVSLNLAVMKGGATKKQIGTWGMYVNQIFDPFPRGGLYGALPAENGMVGETGYGIGLGLILVLVLTIFLALTRKEKKSGNKTGFICLLFAIVSMYMASLLFPWDRLASMGGIVEKLIATMQFPNRMLTVTACFLSVVGMYSMAEVEERYGREIRKITMAIILVGTFFSALYYSETMLDETGFYRIYDETCMGNGYISGGEYILLGTDTSKLTYKEPQASGQVGISAYQKNCQNISVTCENTYGTEAYLDLPLLYYKGYEVADETSASRLPLRLTIGNNNVIRILLPPNYRGTFQVDFKEPVMWRIAELISLLTLAFLLADYRRKARNILPDMDR